MRLPSPPFFIALTLLFELSGVYAIERWLFRAGLSPAAVHAKQNIEMEIASRFEQAVLMLHARQYDHAITALHRVLALSPRLPEAHLNMGFALLGKGEHKAAKDFFDGALALAPELHAAYYGRALTRAAMGERTAASEDMHLFLLSSPEDDPFRGKASELLRQWQEEMHDAR